jgi:EmrB/QacA subfamily drug resistance transporter
MPAPDPRRWLGLLALSISVLTVIMTGTSVNLALPSISSAFGVSISNLTWVIDAYTLALGALTLPGGILGDIFGRRRTYLVGLAIFSVGSILASLAPNIGLLIGARVFMGVGASMVLPGTLSLISAMFEGRERATAIGLWGGMNGIALALGPVVGGALVEYVGWRAVFWINVPLVLVAFVMVPRFVPSIPSRSGLHQLDVPGGAAITGGLTALIVGLIQGQTWGWTSWMTFACLGVAVALLATFAIVESRVKHPMLPLRLFRSRTFSAASLSAVALMISIMSAFFFLSIFLQDVLGFGGVQTGLAYMPMAVFIVGLAPLAGAISVRFGPRLPIIVGLLASALGVAWMSRIDGSSGYGSLVGGLLLVGIGLGLASPPISNAAISSAPRDLAGVASGMNAMARQVGGSIGIALLTAIFANRFTSHLTAIMASVKLDAHQKLLTLQQAANLTAPGAGGAHADPVAARVVHDAFALSMGDTLTVFSAVGVLGVLAALLIRPSDFVFGRTGSAPEPVRAEQTALPTLVGTEGVAR